MNRMVNYWRDLLQPGYHGNPPIASFPSRFFDPKSSSSLSAFTHWIKTDPITTENSEIASSRQVELVALGYGLAFRALWISQFPEEYSDVPAHIITVHTRFQNMNNSVTRFATFFRGMHNRQSHSYCPPCSSYLTTYIGFKRLKPIEHRRQTV